MNKLTSENLLVLDSIAAATFIIDSNRKVVCWNQACASLTGVKAEEVMNTSDHWKGFYSSNRPCLADLVFEDNWLENVDLYHHISATEFSERGLHAENWCQTPNGNKYLIFDANAIFDDDGKVQGVIETLRDASQLIKAQHELQKLITAVEQSPAATYITDAQHIIEYVNPKYIELTGYNKEELLGTDPKKYNTDSTADAAYDELLESVKEESQSSVVLSMKRKDNSNFWTNTTISSIRDEENKITNYIGINLDFTKEYEIQNELKHRAAHDSLTGLMNRREFDNRVELLLNDKRLQKILNVICFIDLDNFKAINDTYGHDAGDSILIDVANILKDSTRDTDSAARFGGDEFAILLKDCRLEDGKVIIEKILSKISKLELSANNPHLNFGASIGVLEFNNKNLTIDELLKRVDIACYEAKGKGKNCMYVYTGELIKEAASH